MCNKESVWIYFDDKGRQIEPISVPHEFGWFHSKKNKAVKLLNAYISCICWATHKGVSLFPSSKISCQMLTNNIDSQTTCDETTIHWLRGVNNYTNMQNTLVGSSEKRISKQSKCSHNLRNLHEIESSHKKLPSNQQIHRHRHVHRNAKYRSRIQN